jgi:hypothetical protein
MGGEPVDSPAPLHYSNLPDSMPREGRLLAAFVTAILLTFVSLVVVMKSANDEPYMMGVKTADVILHLVGVACILGWVALAVAAVHLLRRRHGTYMVVIAMFVWATVNLLYLGATVLGYVQDVLR